MADWHRRAGDEGYRTIDASVGPSAVDERAAVEELWALVRDELVPLHGAVPWDEVRCEVWPDSGRLIVFPAVRGAERDELGSIQLTLASLLIAGESHVHLGMEDDEAFHRLIRAEEQRVVALCVECLERHGFEHPVVFYEYGEELLVDWRPS